MPAPASVQAVLSLDGSVLSLDISVHAVLCRIVTRCTDPLTQTIETHRVYLLHKEDMLMEDTELTFTPDGKLDLQELAYTELVLEVPTVLLCSDTCEGLCPVCGQKSAWMLLRGFGCGRRLTMSKQLL